LIIDFEVMSCNIDEPDIAETSISKVKTTISVAYDTAKTSALKGRCGRPGVVKASSWQLFDRQFEPYLHAFMGMQSPNQW
jgi:hypothetical protein